MLKVPNIETGIKLLKWLSGNEFKFKILRYKKNRNSKK